MEIAGEDYAVTYRAGEACVHFSGILRLGGMPDYQPMLDLMTQARDEAGGELCLDLTRLSLLNSSGIAMLSKFVIACRSTGAALRIRGSSAIAWQGKSLYNLQRLMPGMQVEISDSP
jgi:hypothetical protein